MLKFYWCDSFEKRFEIDINVVVTIFYLSLDSFGLSGICTVYDVTRNVTKHTAANRIPRLKLLSAEKNFIRVSLKD